MYYYNNELPPQQGWVCPKCGRVNAPWKSSCDCVSTQTTGTGTAYLVKTSSVSQDSHEIAEQTEPMIYPQVDGITPSVIQKVGYATDSVTGEILGMTLDTDCSWK